MKKYFSALIISFIFLCFVFLEIKTNNYSTVLNIITPTTLQIDINNNNIIDNDETFCVDGVESFTANLNTYQNDLIKKYNISLANALSIGFMADGFADNMLSGKKVKVKLQKQEKTSCRNAKIFINGNDYGEFLKESGLGYPTSSPYDKDLFSKVLAKADRLKLVIFNHKSLKYHTLDCKYGQIASDAIVIKERDLDKKAKPCKFCHIEKKGSIMEIAVPPNVVEDKFMKLILTDFTKNLKPNTNCTNSVCVELLKNIENSTETIDIALYGWVSIPKIEKALENAISRGVKIRLVYDTNTRDENYYPNTLDIIKKINYNRSDYILGMPKLTNMLMHNKFIIFDKKIVYTGSMNFSNTGLSGFNHNNVLIINSPAVAEIYTNEFEQMFAGSFHTLKQKTQNNENIILGNSSVSIYFSPQDNSITNILPIIKNAKKYLYLPVFLITHAGLEEELINAKKRGVDVRIIIDATNTYARNSSFEKLRQNGIPVKVENYAGKMHSKAIIADDKFLIIGSTNFSNSGENNNDENLILLDNPRFAILYKNFFLYLWQKIPDRYLKHTVKAESKYSIGSCSDGIDNDFDGKFDLQESDCH